MAGKILGPMMVVFSLYKEAIKFVTHKHDIEELEWYSV